jgi:fibronectin type 3 domain-containing protein
MPGGFLIYRRAKSSRYAAALTSQVVEAPHYEDAAASLGGEFCYVVRTAISTDPPIESDASNEVCLKVEDVTAPSPPTGVTTLAVESGIEVSWSPSGEIDVASYRIQRAVKGAQPERIGEVVAPTTSFRDTTASQDKRHRYTVTSVDQAGNESQPSAPAEASWP